MPSVRTVAGEAVHLFGAARTFIPEASKSPVDLPFLFAFIFLFTDEHHCGQGTARRISGFQTVLCCRHGQHTRLLLVIACCVRDKCPLAWKASSSWLFPVGDPLSELLASRSPGAGSDRWRAAHSEPSCVCRWAVCAFVIATEAHVQLSVLTIGTALGRKVHFVPLFIKGFIRREEKSLYLLKMVYSYAILTADC